MNEMKPLLQKKLNQWKARCEWVGIRVVSEKVTQLIARDDKPEGNEVHWDRGLMIEVLNNGQFAYVGTSGLTELSLDQAFDLALDRTKKLSALKLTQFTPEFRPPYQGKYESPAKISFTQKSRGQIFDYLIEATQALKTDSKIVSRSAFGMIVETTTQMLSSTGADIQQDFSIVTTSLSSTAQSEKDTQTRTQNGDRGNCLQIGAEVFDSAALKQTAARISEEAIQLCLADNCPTETTNVLLAPDQMTLQVHESIGHPLEYDRILGDERNYAGWSFVKPDDFGKLQYGSSLMNVTFDPSVSGEMASYGFDDVGNKATKEYLIQDGKLLRGLGGIESQRRLNLPGVANSRSSSWNRAPIDRMANINLEAGKTPLSEIIANTEKGIFMQSNKSWSIDDYRNKFQFGCEYAQLIENGKITKTVKNPNYRGVTVPFWTQLAAVSSEVEIYGSPYCGKGEPNQVIRVGHRTPYCLFKNVEVFGG